MIFPSFIKTDPGDKRQIDHPGSVAEPGALHQRRCFIHSLQRPI